VLVSGSRGEIVRKKIDVADLRLGMYVEDLDRPWIETPFLLQGLHLRTAKDIDQIQRLCQHVYVDTDRCFDFESPEARAQEVPVLQNAKPSSKAKSLPEAQAVYDDRVSFEEEAQTASELHHQVKSLLDDMEHDIRAGRSIDTDSARQVVSQLVESVVRNPDALMWHTQLKRKDQYTALHSLNVCIFALAFGRRLGFPVETLNELGLGALLHDAGKLRIPVEILNKPGKLTAAEMDLMRHHTQYGVEVLRQAKGLSEVVIDVAYSHHERADGSGYPRGLPLEKISPLARLVSIVDYYDAMTSDRVYRHGVSSPKVTKLLYETRGRLFEAHLIEEFIQCLGIFPVGSLVELQSGEVGIVVSVNGRWHLRPKLVLVRDAHKRPYQPLHVLDLSKLGNAAGSHQILHVLDPGSFGVDVRDYVHEIVLGMKTAPTLPAA
jgi:putative nucleotidyltransferase with HDIG domain